MKFKLNKTIKNEAIKLTRLRLKAYDWVSEYKYGKHILRSNNLGSLGELSFYYLLKYYSIPCKPLFNIFTDQDKGDLQVGNLYIEIKTRTRYDFLKYGNQTPLKQVNRYRKRQLNIVYIWISINSNTMRFEGWNKLGDFQGKFIDDNDYSTSCKFIRTFKSLLRLCINSHIYSSKYTND